MAETPRTLQVWQTEDDARKLSEYGWNFHISKSVLRNGQTPIFNVVWQSKQIAPNSIISWSNVYGLNWTANFPIRGGVVEIGGKWQQCAPGEVFDLSEQGFFQSSTEPPNPEFIKVGKTRYKNPDVDGVHIVLGIRNGNRFVPIFVDPVALPPHSTAEYKPLDEVKWWYEVSNRTSTMISNDIADVKVQDFSKPNRNGKYYYSTSFSYKDGTWSISPDEPSQ